MALIITQLNHKAKQKEKHYITEENKNPLKMNISN